MSCILCHFQRLVSGGNDKTIRIWDVGRADVVNQLEGFGQCLSIATSPDCQSFVFGDLNGRVVVSDIELADHFVLTGHEHVNCVLFSPDAQNVISCGGPIYDSYDIAIWDLRSRKQSRALVGHSDIVCAVASAPTDGVVASAGYDNAIHLWKVDH